jgi:RimJ/RimL family protein N-acetyltransferase
MNSSVIETERLTLREFSTDDAPFILRLLNEHSFVRFIGDKGVRNLEDARHYILNGPVASYAQNGFGLFLVYLKANQTPLGMCGLLKREVLEDVDIGFAFLPEFWNKGYALEAAAGVMSYAKNVLKLPRIVAITNKDNDASGKLLEKLGLHFDRLIKLPGDKEELRLFVTQTLQK